MEEKKKDNRRNVALNVQVLETVESKLGPGAKVTTLANQLLSQWAEGQFPMMPLNLSPNNPPVKK